MSKFNVGDIVTIRGDLIPYKEYGSHVFVRSMSSYCGIKAKITHVLKDGEYIIDNDIWSWTEEMFEEGKEEKEMKNNIIKFAKLRNDVIIPSRIDENAGYDVYANFEEDYMIIYPHETKMIPTGLISAFSSDYVAILKERGSTGSKGFGQRCGVIDSGYRGEWFVPLTNHNDYPIVIAKEGVKEKDYCVALTGHKDITMNHIIYPYEKAITQIIMLPVPKLDVEEVTVEEIKAISSQRGEGCLGDSGK